MRSLRFAVLFFLAFGVAGYAVVAYGFLPIGSLVHPDMRAVFETYRWAIIAHVFGAAVALVLGPFQFVRRIRSRHVNVHRWMGRTYLTVGVLIGGGSGLFLAMHAFGGLVAKTGFGGLALAWLYTGLQAYRAIRAGHTSEHQRWMVRNFALTCAAITLRLYLPASQIAGISFDDAYPVIAWMCWVPNLIVAEMVARKPPLASRAAS